MFRNTGSPARSLSSGGHSADPLAGDDGGECGALIA